MTNAITAACLLAVCVIALPAGARGDAGAADPHAECRRAEVQFSLDRCLELTDEILAAHERGEVVERFISCRPNGVSRREAGDAVAAWMRKRPTNVRYSAVAHISGGLSVLYPCR